MVWCYGEVLANAFINQSVGLTKYLLYASHHGDRGVFYSFSFFFFNNGSFEEHFFFFFFLAMPCIMWDLNSPTRIKTAPPAEEVWRLNHRTAREVPGLSLLKASRRLVPQDKAPDHRLVFTSFTHQPHVPFQSHLWPSPL